MFNMTNQDAENEYKEMREALDYLHLKKNEPTSILITKLFIHPLLKSDLWKNADGFFDIIEGIIDVDVKNKLKDILLSIHLTTSFTINVKFEVPIFTVTLIFINEDEINESIHFLIKNFLDKAQKVTGIEPELHFYPFEVFFALIDEVFKPNREEVILENTKGIVDEVSLRWLNNLCYHSFRTDVKELLIIRNSRLGDEIMDIERRAVNG